MCSDVLLVGDKAIERRDNMIECSSRLGESILGQTIRRRLSRSRTKTYFKVESLPLSPYFQGFIRPCKFATQALDPVIWTADVSRLLETVGDTYDATTSFSRVMRSWSARRSWFPSDGIVDACASLELRDPNIDIVVGC